MSINIITVATNNEGYYPILQESAKKNNFKLITLGFGKKWEGFVWKFNKMKEYLQKLNDNDIVIFVDAYDVFVVNKIDELIDRFKSFNTPILLSKDDYDNIPFIQKILYNKIFPRCNDVYINSGAYMGYVYAIKNMIDKICDGKCNNVDDDQRLLASKCNKFEFKIDVDSKIFYNTSTRKINDNIDPIFIHGPGNTDLSLYLKKYGYIPYSPVKRSMIIYFYKAILNYWFYFKTELIILILVLLVIIGFRYRHYLKKYNLF